MSITRSQIARQMYADGALVDPRMANTLEQNKAINNANAQINQAMRSSGGLKSLYDQYGISDADRSRLSGGMASRNMILQNSHREELVKQLAGLQNPFKNLGFLDTQRHFDNNQLLKNAVSRGELSNADYNRLGGFDVAQTMGAGNPVLGGIGNLIGSTGYNIVQSLKGNQSPFDIPGDVFRNVQGGTGLISDDLKTQYENIINSSTPTPNASTDRPTMADVAGPGTSNNLLSLFERYKDIQTPAGADPNNPDFVGETALGNIERGISDFLKSDRGLKYGKDIPLDINDIYSFIEAQRRSFSPDLSQNYQGGNLYNYLQDFYQYKYGNPRIELPSGNYGYYDEQGPDGPVSNERENIFKSYFNQPYKYGLKDGGRIGFANGGRGYNDFASPSSTTASQDFSTQAVSGGQTNYVGGDGSYDYIPQPTVAKLNTITTPGDGTYVNPNKTVIETLRDSNFLSNFQRKGIDRALADRYAREVQRLAPYVIGDMDKDYYFGDLKTAADLGLKNAPTTLPGGKTDIPGTAEYLAFNTIGLPALGLQSLTNLLDKALAPPATLEGAIATRNKMQGIYDDIGRIGQTQFENKYMNNPPPTIDGGDNQPIRLPIIAEAPSDVESTPSNFDLYAALEGREAMRFGQNSYGYTGAMQRFAEGGRARRGYGLGGIIKSVGKAVKKVLKSDVGKAAVGLASLYYGPKLFGADKGFSSWKDVNFLKSMQDKPLPWILGASAVAGLTSSKEEEENLDDISDRTDESGLKELIAKYPALRFQVQPQYQLAANGGRMGYEEGGNINPADLPMSRESLPTYEDIETGEEVEYPYENKERSSAPDIDAELFQMYLDAIGSGKIPRSTTFDQYKELMGEKASMSPERTMANEGGLMSLGGNEMDLRGGGFVPLGAKEKADDVPARLSKNEFVFTADAVRAAGGGDVDRGANLMYKTMKNLESRVG
jgi:hypothetical protein